MPNIQRLCRKRIGDILLQAGVIDDVALQAAITVQAETGDPLGAILVRRGSCNEHDILRTLARKFSVPCLSADQIELSAKAVHLLPLEFMQQHLVVPLDRFGGCLAVLAAGLLPPDVIQEIEKHTGCEVQLVIGTAADIGELITRVEEIIAETKAKGRGPGDTDAGRPAAKTSASS